MKRNKKVGERRRGRQQMRWNMVDVATGNQFEALEDIEKNKAETKEKSTSEQKNTVDNENMKPNTEKGHENTNHTLTPIRLVDLMLKDANIEKEKAHIS